MAPPLIVLDTTVLVDLLRGFDASRQFVDALDRRITCSEVTRVELLQKMRSHERSRTERLLSIVHWVPVDDGIARHAGMLGRRFRQSHSGIGAVDLIVAATALELQAPLATHNVRHFPMFKGLQPPY